MRNEVREASRDQHAEPYTRRALLMAMMGSDLFQDQWKAIKWF